jgi:hypothetical protein
VVVILCGTAQGLPMGGARMLKNGYGWNILCGVDSLLMIFFRRVVLI